MKSIIVFDTPSVAKDLLPMTFTRPVGDLRVGIDTIAEKWMHFLPGSYSWLPAEECLAPLYPTAADEDSVYVAGHILPDEMLAQAIASLQPAQALVCSNTTVAYRGQHQQYENIEYTGELYAVEHLYDIFGLNGMALTADFSRITAGRTSAPLSESNTVIGDRSLVFLEEGARVEGAFINTSHGPVYIGRDAEVMEGSMLRGPIAVCEHAVVNMGTKIYPDTTIGPWCKVGGEINNVVFHSYSNKAHDGFLGNAVIGQWCNLGAGCVASNLKNDYTPIRLWNYPTGRFLRTGLQFCGLIMGDHSKAGINTMFNTATVLGVGVNIHGSGFPRNFVPSFEEGSTAGFSAVPVNKFLDIARRMMERRHITLTPEMEELYRTLYQQRFPEQSR